MPSTLHPSNFYVETIPIFDSLLQISRLFYIIKAAVELAPRVGYRVSL